MNSALKHQPSNWIRLAVFGLAMMVMSSAFTAVGFLLAYQTFTKSESEMPMVLKAEAASGGKGISMATGFVSNDIEALFVLDHLTGRLQCWILNPQTGQTGGVFYADVNADLGIDQTGGEPDYVIVTGRIDVTGRGRNNNLRPGASICYVGDGNTGNVVAYGFQLDVPAINRGEMLQPGQLTVVARGIARTQGSERDQ